MSLSGKQLGDFLLDTKLGTGGMGEVYRARQVSLDRVVAVKVLPRLLATQEGFEERFRREAKAAANLIHPNVIQVYHIGIDPDAGTPYFAMEFVEGEDLQQRMKRLGRVPFEQAVEIICGVTSALACAYEKGIVHRDIKPSNIMIDRSEIVKVMDFGLAKATQETGGSQLTRTGLIMGTPNYISPEAGRGDAIDSRSDIYSLGVVFYELLTGTLPFSATTPAAIIYKHVYEFPPAPREVAPDIPPFLEEICLRMMAKEPKDRYPNAKALLADLNEFKRHSAHYLGGGARRSPAIGSGSLAGDQTLSASGEFPGRPGAGSRSSVATQSFKASETASDATAIGPATVSLPGAGRSRAPLIAIGVAVLVLITAGVVGLAVRSGSPGGGGATGGSAGGASGTGSSAVGGPLGGQVVFPASKLERIVPRNVKAFLVSGFDQKPVMFLDIKVDPGDYTILFDKPGYDPVQRTFRVTAAGVTPPLEELKLEFTPKEDVRNNVEAGKKAIEERRYRDAVDLLKGVVSIAPDYEEAVVALGQAKQKQAEVMTEFQRGSALFNERRWTEAIKVLGVLPPVFEQDVSARSMIQSANVSISALKHQRAAFERQLADGLFADARLALDEVAKLTPADEPELKTLRDRVEAGERAFEAGRREWENRSYEEALKHLKALLEIAPNHREGGRLASLARAEIEKKLGAAQQFDNAVTTSQEAFAAGRYEAAAAEARRAVAADPSSKVAADLLERALLKIAEAGIVRRFEALDEAFRSLGLGSKEKRGYALLEMVDPAARPALKAEIDVFAASPIEIHEAEHRDYAVTLEGGSSGEAAVVECTFYVTLVFPEVDEATPKPAGRTTALTVRQKVGLKRAGDTWLFTSFEEIGNANVRQ